MLRRTLYGSVAVFFCLLAAPARAQTAQPLPTPARQGEAAAPADLSITARVTARELRFEKVPQPRVEFTGRPRRDTVWEAERENLPEQVQPGVTYRDIGITLRITSVFADIDRIVAEALGEIPVSDDGGPTENERPAAEPPQPPAQSSRSATAPRTRPRRAAARNGRQR